MTKHNAKAKEKDDCWYVQCPLCRSKIILEECPIPGGMGNNIEFCPECGCEIEVYI